MWLLELDGWMAMHGLLTPPSGAALTATLTSVVTSHNVAVEYDFIMVLVAMSFGKAV